MPKTRRDRSVSYDSSRWSPLPASSSQRTQESPSPCFQETKETLKEWEDARCPVCMEHPHNALLLICSSYTNGCRPYMCDTSYRHSNCFDQFCKSFAKSPSEDHPPQEPTLHASEATNQALGTASNPIPVDSPCEQRDKAAIVTVDLPNIRKLRQNLPCPLCRGLLWGCTVVESARGYMNGKSRSCASETCEYTGTYSDLRKHARVEHPLVRPSQADPDRQRTWRRMERQRDIGDILSTFQSSLGEDRAVLDDDETTLLPIEDGGLLTFFFLIRVFRRPGSGSRNTGSNSWSGASRTRAARVGIRRRPVRLWGERYEEETAGASTRDVDNADLDKLVVLDFFMPGCGGCKALHPKICQFAEKYPDVLFYQVNYEEHKSMCHSLNVHVLPLFRFYRGADGNVCSFSCTNATIKKFKDMLAKHSTERCSLGPSKGLEEKQLIALSANKDLGFSYTPKPAEPATTEIQEVMGMAESLPTKLSDVGAMSRAELRPLPLGVSEGISNEERTLAAAPAR